MLMNPNIASVQTNVGEQSEFQADQVFFLPVTPDFVEQVAMTCYDDRVMTIPPPRPTSYDSYDSYYLSIRREIRARSHDDP